MDLPEWMRNPEPPRLTVGRRLELLVASLPALRTGRERWWRWRSRSRWADRHRVLADILSFAFVALTASVMVTAVLALFVLILRRRSS